MKPLLLDLALLVSICMCAAPALGAGLTLARDGRTAYRIVVAQGAAAQERLAATELAEYLGKITGAAFPVVTDDRPAAAKEIAVGQNRRLAAVKVRVPADLGPQGYLLRTVGDRLVIAGGSPQGTLYGVYGFLDGLGCRWYAADCSRIPSRRRLVVGPLDETDKPAVAWREVYYSGAMDPGIIAKWRLNGNASTIEGGKMVREAHAGWGLWCHSFSTLVPPERYFAAHPEYYGLVGGKRVPRQLCLTNPDVLRITIESLRARMAAQPEAKLWSVSQNDGRGACECPRCKALDEAEGTPMGSLLPFVNAVAAAFPDQTIATLAYDYSRKPPQHLRPAKNVAIQLCDIECHCQSAAEPIGTAEIHRSFRADVVAWGRLCPRIIIWTYVVQFQNLVGPYPNLRVLGPNMQFFVRNHAAGVFHQGNREVGGEFCELKAWLLARLQWDSDADVEALIDDFLAGYYGPAAKPMRQYIDDLHDTLAKSGKRLEQYGVPATQRDGFLSEANLKRYHATLDEPERAVAGDPTLLLRVQKERLSLDYAWLECGYGTVAERQKIADRFFDTARRTGLRMTSEVDDDYQTGTVARYEKHVREELGQ